MAHLRTCLLCGSTYNYCPRCDETEPTYKLKYCGQNCNDIALVMNKYAFKHLTKDEAAAELAKLNVELDKYNDHNKEYLKGILKTEAAIMPEPTVPEAPVEEVKVVPKRQSMRRNKIVNE